MVFVEYIIWKRKKARTGALRENREPGENPGRTRHCMREPGTDATG